MHRHFILTNLLFAVGLLGFNSCEIIEEFIEKPISHELTLNTDSIDIAGESCVYSFVITTNDEFAVLCQEEWVKLQELENNNNNEFTQTFLVTQNTTDEIREGKITIATNYESRTIMIRQGSYPLLRVAEDSLIVNDNNNIVNVFLLNAIDVDFAFSEEWLSFKEKVSDTAFTISIAANHSYNAREGYIYIKSKIGNQSDSIKVIQCQKDALILSQKRFSLPKENNQIDVILKSNIAIEYYITTPEWIIYSNTINTKAMIDTQYQFIISENSSRFDRAGNVIFYNYDHNLSDSLHVQQQGVESVLKIVYNGISFNDKITINGGNVYGVIDWGDNDESRFTSNPSHTYNSEDVRQITIRTHNSEGLHINNIVGVKEIDLFEF